MGLLDGRTLLVPGVLTASSIAFHVARLAQQEGADVVLTSFGRQMKITTAIGRRLPKPAPTVAPDRTGPGNLHALAGGVREPGDNLHGIGHAIGFAPPGAFDFMNASWEDVSTALHVSAYSLKALAVAVRPLLGPGSAVVGLTFYARYAWPVYDWMGVAKAAFESTARYPARGVG